MATEPACRLGLRRTTSRRCQSVVTSKTLPDPIKPSVKRVKSGMKAFVVEDEIYGRSRELQKTSGEALSTPEPAQSYWK